MTAPVGLIDLEEDDRVIPIENSHLSRSRCSCGAVALVAPGQRGRCGACRRVDADAGPGVAPEGPGGGLSPLGQGYPPHPTSGREDYPAPVLTSRDAPVGVIVPAPVEKLAEKARKAGWRVKVQASRGCPPNSATGAPCAVRTLYGVILGNGRYGAYGVRDDVGWKVMLWGHNRTWFSLANVTELGEYIEARGEMPDSWYAGVRRRIAEAEVRKADRALCDKGLHRARYLSQTPGPLLGTWCELCSHSWPRGAAAWVKPKKGKEDTAR